MSPAKIKRAYVAAVDAMDRAKRDVFAAAESLAHYPDATPAQLQALAAVVRAAVRAREQRAEQATRLLSAYHREVGRDRARAAFSTLRPEWGL